MFSLRNPSTIILLLACLQVLCSTYFLYIPNFYAINSVLFLIAGIGISICLVKLPLIKARRATMLNRQLLLKLLFIILLLPVSYQLARGIMDHTPLQIEYADMLPIIKTMCTRFLNGEWNQVYQPIQGIWNGVQPVYLPALWMPFLSSLIFDFDLRWITVCGIWLGVMLCLLPRWKKGCGPFLLSAGLLTLLAWLHLDTGNNNVIRLTEEGVVFFYYALLTVAIIIYNPWLLGTAIGLCLLSRYSLIGWIPFAILFLLFAKKYRFLLKSIGATVLVVVTLILPFGLDPLLFHLHFQQDYILQATKVWRENPEFFYHSLGMAKFFGPNRIKLLHSVLIMGTFLLPLAFLFSMRKKILTQSNILLAGFQLSISFFYNFIDVSYLYLFYTPVFVSLAIAGWSLSGKPISTSRAVDTFK